MSYDYCKKAERDFAARVRYALKLRSKSITGYRKELDRRTSELPDGISGGTFKNVLRQGSKPSIRFGLFLSRDLSVSAGWLLTGEGSPGPTEVFGLPDDLDAWGLADIDVAAGAKLVQLVDKIALVRTWGTAESLGERDEAIRTVCRSLAAMLLLPRRSPYFRDIPNELYDNAFADALTNLEVVPGSTDSEALSRLRSQVHSREPHQWELVHPRDGVGVHLDDDGLPVLTLTIRGNWNTSREAHACVRDNAKLFEEVSSVGGSRIRPEAKIGDPDETRTVEVHLRSEAGSSDHEFRVRLEKLMAKGLWAGLDDEGQPCVTLSFPGTIVGESWAGQLDALNWLVEHDDELLDAVATVGRSDPLPRDLASA